MTTALRPGVTDYTTPTDRDLVATRVVAAPRGVVFDAWTNPKHVAQWLLGPEGWTMPVCEIDLRPGGKWRYTWRRDNGKEFSMDGTYREVARPDRIVFTERWGPEWPETVNTVVFTEAHGMTTMTMTMRYASKEIRDKAMGTGMTGGMEVSFARLDRLIPTFA